MLILVGLVAGHLAQVQGIPKWLDDTGKWFKGAGETISKPFVAGADWALRKWRCATNPQIYGCTKKEQKEAIAWLAGAAVTVVGTALAGFGISKAVINKAKAQNNQKVTVAGEFYGAFQAIAPKMAAAQTMGASDFDNLNNKFNNLVRLTNNNRSNAADFLFVVEPKFNTYKEMYKKVVNKLRTSPFTVDNYDQLIKPEQEKVLKVNVNEYRKVAQEAKSIFNNLQSAKDKLTSNYMHTVIQSYEQQFAAKFFKLKKLLPYKTTDQVIQDIGISKSDFKEVILPLPSMKGIKLGL